MWKSDFHFIVLKSDFSSWESSKFSALGIFQEFCLIDPVTNSVQDLCLHLSVAMNHQENYKFRF